MNYVLFLGALLVYFILRKEENKKHKRLAIVTLGSFAVIALLYNFGYLIGAHLYNLEQAIK
ncbi:MAG: hypothetical protein HWD85_08995 [Flavobacteriaceae bacterium]|nr:hypothetical protein [Flavobacteriaceae bacterium]